MQNKKLVKRVVVASLAALMTIPNLTIPVDNNPKTVYAGAVESQQRSIKHAQEMIEKFKKEGNEEGVKNWTKNLERLLGNTAAMEAAIKADENSGRIKAANEQRAIEQQAAAAEKDRIANTVYPLHARYVKDFVAAVDDHKPHFYERPDLPGVIFTLK